jgi:DNA-binding NarL/FixJ family response regulator
VQALCGSRMIRGLEAMLEPEEVSAILRLNELGWGVKKISRELGLSRNTVRDYIATGGWTPY